jgi:hypothetical protein
LDGVALEEIQAVEAMPKCWADRAIMFSVVALVAWAIIGLPIYYSFSGLSYYGPALQQTSQQVANGTQTGGNWLTKDAAGFFTFLLVVVGCFQVCLFLWQLWLIRESLDDAKISAEAAKEAADAAREGAKAARDSADIAKLAMTASERAYVHFNGLRWISHRNLSDGSVFWRLRPQWINSGNTPTRHLRCYIHYEIRGNELPIDYPFTPEPHPEIPTLIAPNGIIESAHRDITGADLVAIRERTKHLYVWGIARYRDVFPGTPERITKFCVSIDAIMGNPLEEWNEKTNNVDLRFVNYPRHNCTDEDCEE